MKEERNVITLMIHLEVEVQVTKKEEDIDSGIQVTT